MAKKQPVRPTDAEVGILRVLWERGPSTVREVWQELKGDRQIGYTTVLKQLQVMTEKGLVRADKRRRSHVYRAAVTQEGTQARLLRDLVRGAFAGSGHQLVMRALSHHPVSPQEREAIRRFLDEQEHGQ